MVIHAVNKGLFRGTLILNSRIHAVYWGLRYTHARTRTQTRAHALRVESTAWRAALLRVLHGTESNQTSKFVHPVYHRAQCRFRELWLFCIIKALFFLFIFVRGGAFALNTHSEFYNAVHWICSRQSTHVASNDGRLVGKSRNRH